jgi:hypothetical protein
MSVDDLTQAMWQFNILGMLQHITSIANDDLHLYFNSINKKLYLYNALKDVPALLELVIWKLMIMTRTDYCSPTYGMRIHKACRSGLAYPITQNSITLLLEPQVDTRSYGTLLAPSTMTRVSVQRNTTQKMFATRCTRWICYKRMY